MPLSRESSGPRPGVSVVVTSTDPAGGSVGVVGDRAATRCRRRRRCRRRPRRRVWTADGVAEVGQLEPGRQRRAEVVLVAVRPATGTTTARLGGHRLDVVEVHVADQLGVGQVARAGEALAELPCGPAGQLLDPADPQAQRLAQDAVVVRVVPVLAEADGERPRPAASAPARPAAARGRARPGCARGSRRRSGPPGGPRPAPAAPPPPRSSGCGRCRSACP